MTIDLKIKNLDKLMMALRLMPAELTTGTKAMFKGIAEHLRGKIAVYPSDTQANRPPGVNGYSWYERGFGTRTVTGRAYPTSENLGKSWTTQVRGFGDNMTAFVGTRASYAPYVQDAERQAQKLGDYGWGTVQEALRASEQWIKDFGENCINRIIGGALGSAAGGAIKGIGGFFGGGK
jgi:phage gpG-like protein